LWLIFQGENLDRLKAGVVDAPGGRDLLAEAESALEGGRSFEIDEVELNAHIGRVLQAREGDGFEIFAEFEGLWVRLLEGAFELVIERDVLGVESTVAVRVDVIPAEGGHGFRVTGGRFGRLPVPAGAMYLVRGGLRNIAAVFEPEKGVLSQVGAVTISPGRLRLERSSGRF